MRIGHMLSQEFYLTVKRSITDVLRRRDKWGDQEPMSGDRLEAAVRHAVSTLATETVQHYHASKESDGDVENWTSKYEDPAAPPHVPRGVPHFRLDQ